MVQARAGMVSASHVWGRDKYFRALSEAGAEDASGKFYQEFIDACNELGVGDY